MRVHLPTACPVSLQQRTCLHPRWDRPARGPMRVQRGSSRRLNACPLMNNQPLLPDRAVCDLDIKPIPPAPNHTFHMRLRRENHFSCAARMFLGIRLPRTAAHDLVNSANSRCFGPPVVYFRCCTIRARHLAYRWARAPFHSSAARRFEAQTCDEVLKELIKSNCAGR